MGPTSPLLAGVGGAFFFFFFARSHLGTFVVWDTKPEKNNHAKYNESKVMENVGIHLGKWVSCKLRFLFHMRFLFFRIENENRASIASCEIFCSFVLYMRIM